MRHYPHFGKKPLQMPAGRILAASPLYLRKSSTFPEGESNEESGSAAGGEAALEVGDDTVKQRFTANRQAKPEEMFYRVIGQPEDLAGAKELADKDKYSFQWWILPLIGAKAFGSEAGKKVDKKGADGGIDGMIVFTDDNSAKAKKVIVSVKGGGVNVSQIRDLGHAL